MKAKIEWQQDVLVVGLDGQIDFENVREFRKKSLRHFTQNKVIFRLDGLDFVGSTGLMDFVQTLKEVSELNPNGIGLCQLSFEFEKLLQNHETHKLLVFEDFEKAMQHYQLSSLDFIA